MPFISEHLRYICCHNCHRAVALGNFIPTKEIPDERAIDYIDPVILCDECQSDKAAQKKAGIALANTNYKMIKLGRQFMFAVRSFVNQEVIREFQPDEFRTNQEITNESTRMSNETAQFPYDDTTLDEQFDEEALALRTDSEGKPLKKAHTPKREWKTRVYADAIEVEKPMELAGLLVDEVARRVAKRLPVVEYIDEYDTFIRFEFFPKNNPLDLITPIRSIMENVIKEVFGNN